MLGKQPIVHCTLSNKRAFVARHFLAWICNKSIGNERLRTNLLNQFYRPYTNFLATTRVKYVWKAKSSCILVEIWVQILHLKSLIGLFSQKWHSVLWNFIFFLQMNSDQSFIQILLLLGAVLATQSMRTDSKVIISS